MSKQQGVKFGDFEPVHHISLKSTDSVLNKNKNSVLDLFLKNKQMIEEHFPYILELCKKYSNDMELGNKVREYLKNIK